MASRSGLIEEILSWRPTPPDPTGGILAEMATGQIRGAISPIRIFLQPAFGFMNGTAFRRQVWNAITLIPTGQSQHGATGWPGNSGNPGQSAQACGNNPHFKPFRATR